MDDIRDMAAEPHEKDGATRHAVPGGNRGIPAKIDTTIPRDERRGKTWG